MRLRTHHLICLHFFKGEGYTKEYIENLKSILERAKREKQEEIEVVMGADDVCKPCPYLKDEICRKGEERIAELDLLAMNLIKIKPGDRIRWEYTESKLPEIIGVWKKYACFDCEYAEICSKDERWKGGG
jgi:hypothetical protein